MKKYTIAKLLRVTLKSFARFFVVLLVIGFAAVGGNPSYKNRVSHIRGGTFYSLGGTGGKDDLSQMGVNTVKKMLSYTDLSDLLAEERLTDLQNAGVQIMLKSLYKTDDDNITITFRLKSKKGRFMDITRPAKILYSGDQYQNSSKGQFFHISIMWGNMAVSGDELIVTTCDKVEFYDINSFEKLNKTLDIMRYEKHYMLLQLVDTITTKNGYLCGALSTTGGMGYGVFLSFDKNGNFTGCLNGEEKQNHFRVKISPKENNWAIYRKNQFEGFPIALQWLDEDSGLLAVNYTIKSDYDGDRWSTNPKIENLRQVPGVICDFKNKTTNLLSHSDSLIHHYTYAEKDYTLAVVQMPGATDEKDILKNLAAVYYEKGKLKGFIPFSMGDYAFTTGFPKSRVEKYSLNKRFVFHNSFYNIQVEADFDNGAVTVGLRDHSLSNTISTSSDGTKFLLWGHYYKSTSKDFLVVYDSVSDTVLRIGENHYLYSLNDNISRTQGYASDTKAGFLEDGNIYIKYNAPYSPAGNIPDEYYIYNRSTGECIYSENGEEYLLQNGKEWQWSPEKNKYIQADAS